LKKGLHYGIVISIIGDNIKFSIRMKTMLQRFFADTKKYFQYSVFAAKSQLKSEVADSYLNWVWWVLDPFCFMLIYTFIFGL